MTKAKKVVAAGVVTLSAGGALAAGVGLKRALDNRAKAATPEFDPADDIQFDPYVGSEMRAARRRPPLGKKN